MATTAFNSDVTATGFGVSSGNTLSRMVSTTVSVNFAAVPNNGTSSVTVALSGASAGDTIVATPGSNWSGTYGAIAVTAQCLASGVATLYAANASTATIDPDASTFRVTAFGF